MYTLNEPLSSRDEVELVLGPCEGGDEVKKHVKSFL
nr:MAG TPA: hypothetical protein [Caudoviricetes sp.]